MKLLLIGSGGREHALQWKLSQSPRGPQIFAAPGNPGMRQTVTVPLSKPLDLARFALEEKIDLTVVGPEAPLCAGIVDLFRQQQLPIFGPDRAAAQLEGSKLFAKRFMQKYGIPTAATAVFQNLPEAAAYLRGKELPLVVKADGLAAGKGVTVAQSQAEALGAVEACFAGAFGDAGKTVLIEECLIGEEASIIALTDGTAIIPMASAQDHKRIGERDTGPNTGGMGAYSPAPVVTPALMEAVNRQVLQPFLRGCQQEKLDYRGVIYAGIMITSAGIKVLEFNVRLGDPETQAILPRLESDLVEVLLAAVEKRLSGVTLRWTPDPAVCVVMAAQGYPGAYTKGQIISGIETAEATGAQVFHAGTACDHGQLVTNGGRVLGVTARGGTIAEAARQAYRAVDCIHWEGAYSRRDIAWRALTGTG